MSKGGWEVREVDYTPSTDGPGEDTETFYAGTPVAGHRHEAPPSQPSMLSRATPAWIKRVARPTGATDAPEASPVVSGMPLGLIAVGVVGLSGLLIVTVLVGWFVFSPAPAKQQQANQPPAGEPEQEERYQGVKVKKGLQ